MTSRLLDSEFNFLRFGPLGNQPGGNYVVSGNYIYDIENYVIAVSGVAYRQDPGQCHLRARSPMFWSKTTPSSRPGHGGYNEQLDIANGVDGFKVRHNILEDDINSRSRGEGMTARKGQATSGTLSDELFDLPKVGHLSRGRERHFEFLSDCRSAHQYLGSLTTTVARVRCCHKNGVGLTTEGRRELWGWNQSV